MANRFEITISSKDKFSAIFDRLNKQIWRTAADGGKAISGASKVTEVWAQNFERVTRAAGSGLGALKNAAEPLSALSGMAFGGIAGAVFGIAAGLSAISIKWAEVTTAATRDADAVSLNAQELQLWGAAAKLAGFNADKMKESLINLAKKLYLVNNAPNEAQTEKYVLQQLLGIDTKEDAFSVAKKLIQAYESKTTDPQLKSRIGSVLGFDEDSVRLMRKGSDFVLEKLDEAKRKGFEQGQEATAQAERQKVAVDNLAQAWDKLYNSISRAVSPSVTAAAKAMTRVLESAGVGQKESPLPNATSDNNSWLRGLAIIGDSTAGLSGSKPPAGRTSTLSGRFGDSDGGGPVKSSGSALQKQLEALEDINNPATKYSSDAVRNRVYQNSGTPFDEYRLDSKGSPVKVEVTFTNAPPGTSARAKSGGSDVPVRVFHSNIAGSTP